MKPIKVSTIWCALAAVILALSVQATAQDVLLVGAELTTMYLPLLQGKRTALYSNHTGVLHSGKHTLDVLLEQLVDVHCVFSPEHGFRGTADAGEHVASSIDPYTGLPIVSLYGADRAKSLASTLDGGIDAVVVDIQDVGLRYYTYYCTMLEIMDACGDRGIEVIVLDRPNPNGMYVDGPVLDMKYASGVGRLPIPVVHGLTLGEMAQMAIAEHWLKGNRPPSLTVIPCQGYTHRTRYRLPVAPSPNLPNMTAVYLYASLCFFEATPVSLGRGTDKPFQIYGHPAMRRRNYHFTPTSRFGAAKPTQMDQLCHGVDLSGLDDEAIIARGINLEYLIDAYHDIGGDKFFSSFFEKLIGDGSIRQQIADGRSAADIEASWQGAAEQFKVLRRKYLLYPE